MYTVEKVEGLDLFVELINIALVQAISEGGEKSNWKRTVQRIRESSKNGAQVIVLQELFLTDYFCYKKKVDVLPKSLFLHEVVFKEAEELAKELSIVLFLSFYERFGEGGFNTILCIDSSGEQLGSYRKSHIPNDPGYYEKTYFSEGDTGVKVFETSYGRIAPLVCFDQWFPEMARIATLHGAELIVYPTAIGWDFDANPELREEELDAWVTIQRAHAIANGVYVAAVNRVGDENGKTFWGNSFVCGPLGKVIARGGQEEDIIMAEIDFSEINRTRDVWTFLRDRRPDLYTDLTKDEK